MIHALLRGSFAAAAVAALICAAQVRADGISCTPELRATSEKTAADGAARERSGKLVEAYVHYRSAGEYCDVASAREGVRRVGKTLGAAAEKAGHAIGDDRLGFWEAKPNCAGKATPECLDARELEALRSLSAAAWYEGTGNPGETDRVMLAHFKARPGDLTAFRRVWGHFQNREAAGPHEPVKPGSPRVAMQKAASAQAARALEAEKGEFAKGTDAQGTGSARCLAQLEQARTWLEAGLLDVAPAIDRAVLRGDARLAGASLIELGEAERFYEFAGRKDKQEQVRKKALAEGEKALAAGERLRAAQYFTLAGEDERARSLAPKAQPVNIDPEKARKEMMKTDAEKEKFRKEQADLEKELGM